MSSTQPKIARPLSPHLQIYKPQMTSVLSITNRISGAVTSFGSILFVVWLVALAGGIDTYATLTGYAQTVPGQIVLFGLSLSFIYHLCGGIRHLLWDAGLFLDLPGVYSTGYIVIAATVILTALVWLHVWGVLL